MGFHCPKQWGKHPIPTVLGIPAKFELVHEPINGLLPVSMTIPKYQQSRIVEQVLILEDRPRTRLSDQLPHKPS